MIRFTATIEKSTDKNQQTNWTFILLNKAQSNKLNPGVRLGFRVKGKIGGIPISQKALLPVREERFMLPLDAKLRKALQKQAGDKVTVELEVDKKQLKLSADLLECLSDEPAAEDFFNELSPSHQRYFSKWIEDAKTEHTKTKRVTMAVMALALKKDFGKMIRDARDGKE